MKRQLKDREHTHAKITISKIREVFKDGNSTEYKDKLMCIKIYHPTHSSSTAFKDDGKGRKKLLAFIKEELYLWRKWHPLTD